jgi:hypothetical protein
MSEFTSQSGSGRIPTESEKRLDQEMEKFLLNQWTDTTNYDSMKDLRSYFDQRPVEDEEKVAAGEIAAQEKSPLEVGIFQNDVFYDAKKHTVFSIDAVREVGGEKLYSISTVSENGVEVKEIMTETEAQAYLAGKDLADSGMDRHLVNERSYEGTLEAPENNRQSSTAEKADKSTDNATNGKAKKRPEAAKGAKNKDKAKPAADDTAPEGDDGVAKNDAEDSKNGKTVEQAESGAFKYVSPAEQQRRLIAAFGDDKGKVSLATLQHYAQRILETEGTKSTYLSDSIDEAAKSHGYVIPEKADASATTPEDSKSDAAVISETSDQDKETPAVEQSESDATQGASEQQPPEQDTKDAEQDTEVIPAVQEDTTDASGAEQPARWEDEHQTRIDALKARDQREDAPFVRGGIIGFVQGRLDRFRKRRGKDTSDAQVHDINEKAQSATEIEAENKGKRRYVLGAAAVATAAFAVGVGILAYKMGGDHTAGSTLVQALAPGQAPLGGNGGQHTEAARNVLETYQVSRGGNGEDIMKAAGRPVSDWYNGLGQQLAEKLPNEFDKVAQNDIRVKNPGGLSQAAQNIIANWKS